MWMCDHCLEVNGASDNFCTNCGRPQPGTEDLFKPAAPAKPEPVDKRFKAALRKSGYKEGARDGPSEYIPGFGNEPEIVDQVVREEPVPYEFVSHYADDMLRRIGRILAVFVLLPFVVISAIYWNSVWIKSQLNVRRYNSDCTEPAHGAAVSACSHMEVSTAFRFPRDAADSREIYASFVGEDGKREYLRLWKHSNFDLSMVTGDYPGEAVIKTQEITTTVTRWRGHYTDIKANGIAYPLEDNPRNNASGKRLYAMIFSGPFLIALVLYLIRRTVRWFHINREAEGVTSELSRAW